MTRHSSGSLKQQGRISNLMKSRTILCNGMSSQADAGTAVTRITTSRRTRFFRVNVGTSAQRMSFVLELKSAILKLMTTCAFTGWNKAIRVAVVTEFHTVVSTT